MTLLDIAFITCVCSLSVAAGILTFKFIKLHFRLKQLEQKAEELKPLPLLLPSQIHTSPTNKHC
jgi:hypothetical protein